MNRDLLNVIDNAKIDVNFNKSLFDNTKTPYENLKILCEIENKILGIEGKVISFGSCVSKEDYFMNNRDVRNELESYGFTYGYYDDLEDDGYLYIYIFCTESSLGKLREIIANHNRTLVVM